MESLERELETYERELANLLAQEQEGNYVVIHGDEVLGVFAAYEDALQKGYEKVGIEPFLVKRIEATEQLHFITRAILGECRT